MTSPNSRHAHVVGLGLIGASVALALTETGWSVTGRDSDAATVAAAMGREDQVNETGRGPVRHVAAET